MNDKSEIFGGPILLTVGVLGALIAGVFFKHFAGIPLDSIEPQSIGKTLLGLIFFALLIERATQVYVNAQIEPERSKLTEESTKKKAAFLHAEQLLVQAQASGNVAAIQSQMAKKDVAKEVLDEALQVDAVKKDAFVGKTRRQTSVISLVMGIFISLVGIRALAPFADENVFKSCSPKLHNALKIPLGKWAENVAGNEGLVNELDSLGITASDFKSIVMNTSNLCNQFDWQITLFSGIDVFITAALLAGGADGLHQILNRYAGFAQNK